MAALMAVRDTRPMGSAPPVIAILDDEEHFRRALSRLLKAHGYEVASFAVGEELIAEAGRRAFGCVLLDLSEGDKKAQMRALAGMLYGGQQGALGKPGG